MSQDKESSDKPTESKKDGEREQRTRIQPDSPEPSRDGHPEPDPSRRDEAGDLKARSSEEKTRMVGPGSARPAGQAIDSESPREPARGGESGDEASDRDSTGPQSQVDERTVLQRTGSERPGEQKEIIDDDRTSLVGAGQSSSDAPRDQTEVLDSESGGVDDDRTELVQGARGRSAVPDATERLGKSSGPQEGTERLDQTDRMEGDEATRRTGGPPPRAVSDSDSGRSTTGGGGGDVSLTVGSVLRQRFRITGVLGEGGMGAVYSAVDMLKEEARDENVNVALKVMKPDIVDAELSFMGLQREARRAQQLAHPNIVTVYDFDRADGVIYMTMEYMNGKPLDAVLDDKPYGLDLDEARDITTQICKGLAYAHKEGIVHSDLKPQNVFLLDSGRAKILDFGIARAYRAKKVDMVETVFAGYSPAFASPEVIARKSPSPADDVFALGLLVYQLFTGRHPFDWVAADQAVEQGLKPKRDKSFKRSEWAAVQAALSFDGTKRPQDAAEFLKKFAPSRVRKVGLVVSLVSMLVAASWVYFYEPEVGPDIPFEELPMALQEQISRNLVDAELFLSYGDIDGAFQLYDAVLVSHPGNRAATEGIHQAAEVAAERIRTAVATGQISAEAGRQSLSVLLAYETLPSRSRSVLRDVEEAL